MTKDFLQDFMEACEREGVKYFVATTRTGDDYSVHMTIDELPERVERKAGDVVSRKEDFLQMVGCLPFENDESDGSPL